MIKRISEKLKVGLNENNLGITICFILFLGPLAYLFLKHTPLGSVMMSVIIAISCYIWGYLRGEKAERLKQQAETKLNDSQLQDRDQSMSNYSDLD